MADRKALALVSGEIQEVGSDDRVIGAGLGISLTRSALNTLAGSSGIAAGQWYFISDELRMAYGLTTSTYHAEPRLTVGTSGHSSPQTGDLWVDTN